MKLLNNRNEDLGSNYACSEEEACEFAKAMKKKIRNDVFKLWYNSPTPPLFDGKPVTHELLYGQLHYENTHHTDREISLAMAFILYQPKIRSLFIGTKQKEYNNSTCLDEYISSVTMKLLEVLNEFSLDRGTKISALIPSYLMQVGREHTDFEKDNKSNTYNNDKAEYVQKVSYEEMSRVSTSDSGEILGHLTENAIYKHDFENLSGDIEEMISKERRDKIRLIYEAMEIEWGGKGYYDTDKNRDISPEEIQMATYLKTYKGGAINWDDKTLDEEYAHAQKVLAVAKEKADRARAMELDRDSDSFER